MLPPLGLQKPFPGFWLHPQDTAQGFKWRPGLGLEASGQAGEARVDRGRDGVRELGSSREGEQERWGAGKGRDCRDMEVPTPDQGGGRGGLEGSGQPSGGLHGGLEPGVWLAVGLPGPASGHLAGPEGQS